MSRVSEAKRILDIAEKEFLKGKPLKDLRLKYGIASNIINEFMDKPAGKSVLFIVNGVVKAVIDTKNEESFGKQIEGFLGDLATAGINAIPFIAKRTPWGFVVSTALDMAGIDLSSQLKKYYDWATGDENFKLLKEMKISEYKRYLNRKNERW